MKRLMIGTANPAGDTRKIWEERRERAVVKYLASSYHHSESVREAVLGMYRAIRDASGDVKIRWGIGWQKQITYPEKIVTDMTYDPRNYRRHIEGMKRAWRMEEFRRSTLDEVVSSSYPWRFFDPDLLKEMLLTSTRAEAERLVDHILNAAALLGTTNNRYMDILAHAYEYGSPDAKEVVANALNEHGIDETQKSIVKTKTLAGTLLGIGGSTMALLAGSFAVAVTTAFFDAWNRFRFDISNFAGAIYGYVGVALTAVVAGAMIVFSIKKFKTKEDRYTFILKNPNKDPNWRVGPPEPVAIERGRGDTERREIEPVTG